MKNKYLTSMVLSTNVSSCKITILFILIVGSLFRVQAHDFYVGITTFTYMPQENSFAVEIKLTTHDLEKVIEVRTKQALKLASSKEHLQSNQLIADYIMTQLKVSFNGGSAKANFVGKSVELDETIYIFLEFKCPDVVHNMTVKNLLLLDYFTGQENITHIEKNGQKWSYTYTHQRQEKTFVLNLIKL
jgi:ribosomal protein L21E